MRNKPSSLVSPDIVTILTGYIYLLAKRTKDKLSLQHQFVWNVETRMGHDFMIV
jgi:hypothetical protein